MDNLILKADIAIIGGGSGGLSLAAGTAQLGLDVILLEKGLMGGDCLNYGCVPSKSLLAAAKKAWAAKNSSEFGIPASRSAVDFTQVMAHVRGVIDHIAVHDSVERFESLGVRVIQEAGVFQDKETILAGKYTIKAKYMVVAAGSTASVPPIPGVDTVPYFTNENIFSLKELPEHLLVIGGGPIGCELAQAFAMLGAKVTLLEGLTLMGQDDPEAVAIVRDALKKTGVTVYESAKVTKLEPSKNTKITLHAEVNGEPTSFTGTHLLLATGRKANISALHCEKAEIKTDKKGIVVDSRLRSSNKRVYAIGDIAGRLQFTHVANDHAGVVLRNIVFKLPASVKENAIPWVTYTEPELAHVGKNSQQCAREGLEPVILKVNYADNDRAQAEAETQGFIKVMADKKGKVLGVTIVGHQAGELLLPWIIAVREGKTLRTFTDTIIPYPTLSELSKKVASQFYTPKLFSSKVKKIVKFLSWF